MPCYAKFCRILRRNPGRAKPSTNTYTFYFRFQIYSRCGSTHTPSHVPCIHSNSRCPQTDQYRLCCGPPAVRRRPRTPHIDLCPFAISHHYHRNVVVVTNAPRAICGLAVLIFYTHYNDAHKRTLWWTRNNHFLAAPRQTMRVADAYCRGHLYIQHACSHMAPSVKTPAAIHDGVRENICKTSKQPASHVQQHKTNCITPTFQAFEQSAPSGKMDLSSMGDCQSNRCGFIYIYGYTSRAMEKIVFIAVWPLGLVWNDGLMRTGAAKKPFIIVRWESTVNKDESIDCNLWEHIFCSSAYTPKDIFQKFYKNILNHIKHSSISSWSHLFPRRLYTPDGVSKQTIYI